MKSAPDHPSRRDILKYGLKSGAAVAAAAIPDTLKAQSLRIAFRGDIVPLDAPLSSREKWARDNFERFTAHIQTNIDTLTSGRSQEALRIAFEDQPAIRGKNLVRALEGTLFDLEPLAERYPFMLALRNAGAGRELLLVPPGDEFKGWRRALAQEGAFLGNGFFVVSRTGIVTLVSCSHVIGLAQQDPRRWTRYRRDILVLPMPENIHVKAENIVPTTWGKRDWDFAGHLGGVVSSTPKKGSDKNYRVKDAGGIVPVRGALSEALPSELVTTPTQDSRFSHPFLKRATLIPLPLENILPEIDPVIPEKVGARLRDAGRSGSPLLDLTDGGTLAGVYFMGSKVNVNGVEQGYGVFQTLSAVDSAVGDPQNRCELARDVQIVLLEKP